jgi:hypothetical protein
MLRALPFVLLMGVSALAQAPTYSGVGRTPTAEEIRAWDISIGPTGAELPPGEDSGYPAVENRQWLKTHAALNRLPDLQKKVRELEQEIAEIKRRTKLF